MSFLAKTLAPPPFYGNSCDPTHDISFRDTTVSQKIEMSSLFKATLMEILNQNQLRGSQEIQRYQHRKNTESDFFCVTNNTVLALSWFVPLFLVYISIS